MSDIVFTDGLYPNEPSEKAPPFVKMNIGINVETFTEWLAGQPANEKGNIRIVILEAKSGKLYGKLDTYKSNDQGPGVTEETTAEPAVKKDEGFPF